MTEAFKNCAFTWHCVPVNMLKYCSKSGICFFRDFLQSYTTIIHRLALIITCLDTVICFIGLLKIFPSMCIHIMCFI